MAEQDIILTAAFGSAPNIPVVSGITPVELSASSVGVSGGRVATFTAPTPDTVQSISITSQPLHGRATVAPDNTIALVMTGTDFAGSIAFNYTVTRDDASVENRTADIVVSTPLQTAGWGLGAHYMLETAANGRLVVETGNNHRKVYITGSASALSRADIATAEGITEGEVSAVWLRANPQYGGSEGMALDATLGMELWYEIHGWSEDPSSNWLMFERGYQYDDLGQVIQRETQTESEIHPTHITAWGTGSRPRLNTQFKIWQKPSENIVITDIVFVSGGAIATGSNVIMSDMQITAKMFEARDGTGLTFRRSEIVDNLSSPPTGDIWSGKAQGILVVNFDGVLFEDNIFHHNAWETTYLRDRSATGGMPPSLFNHNVYLQYDVTDVTFRQNITSQGASYGAHIRGGGYVEDNLFLDNNVAVSLVGGNYKNFGFVSNYTFFVDNIVTSGGYKRGDGTGAAAWGIQNAGHETSLHNNIVTHLANPDDPVEQAFKELAQMALKDDDGGSRAYDDTIIYNWEGSQLNSPQAFDQNTNGLDTAQADITTFQRYAQAELGAPVSDISAGVQRDGYYASKLIPLMMDSLIDIRATQNAPMDEAKDVVDYFQQGFGILKPVSTDTAHTFIPSPLAEGVRWDNRVNWSSGQVPSDGHTADLNGNWVSYAGTRTLAGLDLGTDGKLSVWSGRLNTSLQAAGTCEIEIGVSGQLWLTGYSDTGDLAITLNKGRFANTGALTGATEITVNGGQAILAAAGASYQVGTLSIVGSAANIGFDGADGSSASITMNAASALDMTFGADGVSPIGTFRSGAFGAAPSVATSFAAAGALSIDLAAYTGGAGVVALVSAGAVTGAFDTVTITNTPSGLTAAVTVTGTGIDLTLS